MQKPHPPIYLAAYSPGALNRAATLANGWHPVGVPLDGLEQMTDGLKSMAQAAGRDPAARRHRRHQDAGANALVVDPTFSPGMSSAADFVRIMEQIRGLA